MRDDERDAAVKAHLDALDAEIARLRDLERAMDRKLAQRGSEEGQPGAGGGPADEPPRED
jgi:hypothetical protein